MQEAAAEQHRGRCGGAATPGLCIPHRRGRLAHRPGRGVDVRAAASGHLRRLLAPGPAPSNVDLSSAEEAGVSLRAQPEAFAISCATYTEALT